MQRLGGFFRHVLWLLGVCLVAGACGGGSTGPADTPAPPDALADLGPTDALDDVGDAGPDTDDGAADAASDAGLGDAWPDWFGGDTTPPPADTPYLQRLAPGAQGFAEFSVLALHGSNETGPFEVVKFFLDGLDGTPQCYLQNTHVYERHYDFVVSVLGFPWTWNDYLQYVHRDPQRTRTAGSLVFYPALRLHARSLGGPAFAPLLLTFFPDDTLTPAQALRAYDVLLDCLAMVPRDGALARLFYLPAGDVQERALLAESALFREHGALWLETVEFYGERRFQLLNPGEAFGRLHYLTPEQLAETPLSIRDVVILARLPNEVPLVGGTITEELQTPLAHVNVAARNRGTPNMALLDAATDPRVGPFIGQLVHLVVGTGDFALTAATLEEAERYWDSLVPGDLLRPPADLGRRGVTPLADVAYADSSAFGVKAANVAELHRLLGDTAPDGFAVPFAHYEEHLLAAVPSLNDCLVAMAGCVDASDVPLSACDAAFPVCAELVAQAPSLKAYIEALLADPRFRGDTALRAAALAGLRAQVAAAPLDAAFEAELTARIGERFGATAVRLRSSTNAEDLPDFSGAGLYSSFSATVGADADEAPGRVVRRVWASVWNRAAFEERAFRGIDHLSVRMAVLIHPAYPDERANGVAITQNLSNPALQGYYVNVQQGETSVTNPEGGALPEIFTLVAAPGGGFQVVRERFSSLSPDAALLTAAETTRLAQTLGQIQWHFARLYETSPANLALDVEFKFHGPERTFIVKQVRPYSRATAP